MMTIADNITLIMLIAFLQICLFIPGTMLLTKAA